ncbi:MULTISPECIES: 3-deoxy-8-phosphooctulonate synthase [Helicobacter]|uniref:2-dehydro-3-deoxyphosphooctonate aldolase n=1 Tax=Helicobacter ibis TaxID=2962633 RepID=A0ABT4VBQ0_9HELI|nr:MULTISPECIES: 3-deoxy-8-phosphooctulonate synthase [Helicobacter]MDA3966904.1 3-deoxy-8-phosphooctulonate synthase [Helicobacter sp. WB40]MDA3968130.1 3-deoxy-8-phosphooctulonate synthase [Helicobacter ibis]
MIIVAGPCVIENDEILEEIAESLKDIANNPKVTFYFKSSFDKANRTSLDSYRGPGLEKGLESLAKIKQKFGYKLLTDIHETYQARLAAEIVDVLQIPAFLCRQTDLIVESAKSKAIVNIKKGQFMNPKDMQYSVLKALKIRGGENATYDESKKHGIYLTERGSSFGYGNLVVDMRSLSIMREFAPVIFDATHAVQMPGGANGKSGGDSKFAPLLARAASAVGIDGLFAEVHVNPKKALSDGPNMLKPNELISLCDTILEIDKLIKG